MNLSNAEFAKAFADMTYEWRNGRMRPEVKPEVTVLGISDKVTASIFMLQPGTANQLIQEMRLGKRCTQCGAKFEQGAIGRKTCQCKVIDV
jgi:hypothetical protein